jgi:hypothetical protein
MNRIESNRIKLFTLLILFEKQKKEENFFN